MTTTGGASSIGSSGAGVAATEGDGGGVWVVEDGLGAAGGDGVRVVNNGGALDGGVS